MRVFAWALVGLAGCSTMSLRVGAVIIGGKPAFQASIEAGPSFGSKRIYALTNEHGTQADANGVSYFNAINADVMTLDDNNTPIARIGPRLRATNTGASLGARGTFYPGLFRDPKSRSGGFGVELGGGLPIEGDAPVIEAALVMTGRWDIY